MHWCLLFLFCFLVSCQEKDPWAHDSSLPETISFNRHVRPLLAEHCLSCHNSERTDGGVRLDVFSGISSVTSPWSPKKSVLWNKMLGNHPVKLPERQLALIWRWIDQGATFQRHWASLPISSFPSPPPTLSPLSPNGRIATEELSFLTRALLNREPTQQERFSLNNTDFTRSAVIQTLMQDEGFAATFPSHLIALSQANPIHPEVHSDQSERPNGGTSQHSPFSPYLRWLETQLSAPDFSLRTFILHSLAGDLVPGGGQQATIATAWTRLPPRNDNHSLAARIGQSFLGIELQQLTNPDHLWPDAQELLPLFFPEPPVGSLSGVTQAPFLTLHTPAELKAMQDALSLEATRWASLERLPQNVASEFQEWLASSPSVSIPNLVAAFSFNEEVPIDSAPIPEASVSPSSIQRLLGIQGTALAAPAEFKNLDMSSSTPFTLAFFLKTSALPDSPFPLLSATNPEGSPMGLHLSITTQGISTSLVNGSPQNAITVQSAITPSLGQWHHLAVSYNGSRKASGLKLWIDGNPIPVTIQQDTLHGIAAAPQGQLLFRSIQADSYAPAAIDELQLFHSALTEVEVRHLRDGKSLLKSVRSDLPREDLLFNHYLQRQDKTVRHQRSQALQTSFTIASLQEKGLRVPIAQKSLPLSSRPLLPIRPLPFTSHPDRLGFAEWLLHQDNSITPRIIASRLYEALHGQDLLPASGDISSPWDTPPNPELLDFLASQLLESNWNLRDLIQLTLLLPPSS